MIKKLTALLLALSMCLALVAPIGAAAKPYIDPSDRDGVWDRTHSYVVTKNLLVRNKPSNKGEIVDYIPAGTAIVDLSKRNDSEWLCIEWGDGEVRYCGKQYCAENSGPKYEEAIIREDTPVYYNAKGTDKGSTVKASTVVTVTGDTVQASAKPMTTFKTMIPCKVGKSFVFIECRKLCYNDAAIIRKKAKRNADILTAVKNGKKDGTVKKGDTVTITGSVGKYYQVPKRSKKKLTFRYVPKAAFQR